MDRVLVKRERRWTVTGKPYKDGNHLGVECLCRCGTVKTVRVSHLESGASLSCGCYRKERSSSGVTGLPFTLKGTRLQSIFSGMKQRCYDPRHPSYQNYGAKGVTICSDWLNDIFLFVSWSIENGYNDDLVIDRIDSSLGYSADNCRWVSPAENNQEMLERNFREKTGQFSPQAVEKLTQTNRDRLGCKLVLKWARGSKEFGCLIEAAEFIVSVKNLTTSPKQIKKNISACLHGKRKTCHGFSFSWQSTKGETNG